MNSLDRCFSIGGSRPFWGFGYLLLEQFYMGHQLVIYSVFFCVASYQMLRTTGSYALNESHIPFAFAYAPFICNCKNISFQIDTVHQALVRPFISGPYSWFQEHPIAINGHRQSPVHILTKDVIKSEILRGIPLR